MIPYSILKILLIFFTKQGSFYIYLHLYFGGETICFLEINTFNCDKRRKPSLPTKNMHKKNLAKMPCPSTLAVRSRLAYSQGMSSMERQMDKNIFVTFNIVIRHIFFVIFIEIFQVVQKI